MPDEDQVAVVPPVLPPLRQDQVVETFEVYDGDKKYDVVANAIANRAMAQINVAKLRAIGQRVVDLYSGPDAGTPSPKDFKAIVDGLQTIEDMAERAYGDKKDGGLSNSIERLIAAAAAGGAAGAKLPDYRRPEGRLARLKQVGKPNAKQRTIDIEGRQ